MSDTISRQAAIDAIENVSCSDGNGISVLKCEAIDDAVRTIRNLPSAQPEQAIKDCRNCKFGNYNDHWNTNFCYCSGDCNNWDKWEPSAQPKRTQERTETHACDCISRQSAINALLDELMEKPERYEDGLDRHDIEAVLGTLPSAQQEIIRCKDCRHNHDCNIQYHAQAGEEFYCGVAERRIDGR